MRPLKEKISITIDSDVLAKIKATAEEDDRSLSQYINLVLRKHLTEQVKRVTINKSDSQNKDC
jgi:hypothetical protein